MNNALKNWQRRSWSLLLGGALTIPYFGAAAEQPEKSKAMAHENEAAEEMKEEAAEKQPAMLDPQAQKAVDNLVSEGIPAERARQVVREALREGFTTQDLSGLTTALGDAVKAGLDAKDASRITRDALKDKLTETQIHDLLTASGDSVKAGASPDEVRHIVKESLEKGGDAAAVKALQDLNKELAAGTNPKDATRDVVRSLEHQRGEGAEAEERGHEPRDMAQNHEGKGEDREAKSVQPAPGGEDHDHGGEKGGDAHRGSGH